ncbi:MULTISPECIES: dTDP-4-dehydrorhamnose 3,5-epimerase family protein [unclassified Micromonospora]|uniref:dTDP-4-dehydrorhamnose 3,5-epimerase family protein n=1 Tax=unclassified Micromonospora TaxID=2617518 RepID=UPI00272E0A28|nr:MULTISPECIES: dTDP-4-dehydrorhamnose 3,5-epimerase family protein [unclassified Micromonospora]
MAGAVEFTPTPRPDDRRLLVPPFQKTAFRRATGRPLMPVTQANHSRSRRGVRVTATPPGCAK